MRLGVQLGTLVCGVALGGCGRDSPALAPAVQAQTASVLGLWRATLQSPGGELPFGLSIEANDDELAAFAHNGPERVPFSRVVQRGRELELAIDTYDSEIHASLSADADALAGGWTKTTPEGRSTMAFAATRGDLPRFEAALAQPGYAVPDSVDGQWSIAFVEDDGSTFAGHGVFESAGDALHGTVLTDTGDYRYLAGRYRLGTLELSCFDGGHAFLLRASVSAEGTLVGDFWSRASYHAAWTGTPLAPGAAGPLGDPYAAVELSPQAVDERFEFAFTDIEGNLVSDRDERFAGKVVIVEIFGTWCPNCNDYAPVLGDWYRRYHDRGLEIVGLAFEVTGDVNRDRAFVRRYADKYGLEFPLLLAGTSDKDDASAALPTLSKIKSYPTTVFVARDGRVHKIHSGFAGPATGDNHTTMVRAMEAEIETLLGS